MTGLIFLVAALPAAAPGRPSPEENILREAGVAADADGLLAYFRDRAPDDAGRKRIAALVRRLGGDEFDDRERAGAELKRVGGKAVLSLRQAARSKDAEVAGRAAKLLKEIDPPPYLPAYAAARLLARRAPAGAVAALLADLPQEADPALHEEIRYALLGLTPDGKPDPALTAALDAPEPPLRASAAYVLARRGGEPVRAAVRKRLTDADAAVRYQAAYGLLAAHDKAAVPALIALLPDGPFEPAWRAEEALRRLAGDAAPDVWLDDTPEGRKKAGDAWAAWWKKEGEGFDPGKYEEPARLIRFLSGQASLPYGPSLCSAFPDVLRCQYLSHSSACRFISSDCLINSRAR